MWGAVPNDAWTVLLIQVHGLYWTALLIKVCCAVSIDMYLSRFSLYLSNRREWSKNVRTAQRLHIYTHTSFLCHLEHPVYNDLGFMNLSTILWQTLSYRDWTAWTSHTKPVTLWNQRRLGETLLISQKKPNWHHTNCILQVKLSKGYVVCSKAFRFRPPSCSR